MSDNQPEAKDASAPLQGAEVLTAHARWLIEWNDRRSEALVSRAVALLGFDGVLLALVVQAAGVTTVRPSGETWVLFVLYLVAVLGSAASAVRVLQTAPTSIPSSVQPQVWWENEKVEGEHAAAANDVAESLLRKPDSRTDNPMESAREGADQRVKWFKVSIGALLLSMILLALLAVDVLARS